MSAPRRSLRWWMKRCELGHRFSLHTIKKYQLNKLYHFALDRNDLSCSFYRANGRRAGIGSLMTPGQHTYVCTLQVHWNNPLLAKAATVPAVMTILDDPFDPALLNTHS